MATKEDLDKLFDADIPKPAIRRGQGLKLSTESSPPDQTETDQDKIQPVEEIEEQTDPVISLEALLSDQVNTNKELAEKKTISLADLPVRHKRVNRGYKLREDLIKRCKMIAVEENRKLYEVMEEALALYLAQKETQ
jgi:hypothetical protein